MRILLGNDRPPIYSTSITSLLFNVMLLLNCCRSPNVLISLNCQSVVTRDSGSRWLAHSLLVNRMRRRSLFVLEHGVAGPAGAIQATRKLSLHSFHWLRCMTLLTWEVRIVKVRRTRIFHSAGLLRTVILLMSILRVLRRYSSFILQKKVSLRPIYTCNLQTASLEVSSALG